MKKEKEIWKNFNIKGLTVIDFPNYKINRKGKIYSVRFKKFLRQQVNNDGYKTVSLANNNIKKTFLVHRMIAEHFIKNPEKLKCVKFKDGDKTNIKKKNLEWS